MFVVRWYLFFHFSSWLIRCFPFPHSCLCTCGITAFESVHSTYSFNFEMWKLIPSSKTCFNIKWSSLNRHVWNQHTYYLVFISLDRNFVLSSLIWVSCFVSPSLWFSSVVKNACFSYGCCQIALFLLWTNSMFIPKVVNLQKQDSRHWVKGEALFLHMQQH